MPRRGQVARAYIAAAPERMVWGSDWPHPTESEKPDDAVLFDLLARLGAGRRDAAAHPGRQSGEALRFLMRHGLVFSGKADVTRTPPTVRE